MGDRLEQIFTLIFQNDKTPKNPRMTTLKHPRALGDKRSSLMELDRDGNLSRDHRARFDQNKKKILDRSRQIIENTTSVNYGLKMRRDGQYSYIMR